MAFSSISLNAEIFIVRPSVKRAMLALAGRAADPRTAAIRSLFMDHNVTTRRPNNLCPGMVLIVHLLQSGSRNVRVDLRRRYVRMPEHHLYRAQIGAVLQQVCGEGVAQHVRRDAPGEAGLSRVLHDL